MYQRPTVTRFGTLRELTLAGCLGATDAAVLPGVGTSIGNTPIIENGTTHVCFADVS